MSSKPEKLDALGIKYIFTLRIRNYKKEIYKFTEFWLDSLSG